MVLIDDIFAGMEYFDGDMILTAEQKNYLLSPNTDTDNFNGLINKKYRWPNKTIPYQLNSTHTRRQQGLIKMALKLIETNTCVKFVERTNESDFIQIEVSSQFSFHNCLSSLQFPKYLTNLKANDYGCFTEVGYQKKGPQLLNLNGANRPGKGCFKLGVILHQFLHGKFIYAINLVSRKRDFKNKSTNLKKMHTSLYYIQLSVFIICTILTIETIM